MLNQLLEPHRESCAPTMCKTAHLPSAKLRTYRVQNCAPTMCTVQCKTAHLLSAKLRTDHVHCAKLRTYVSMQHIDMLI